MKISSSWKQFHMKMLALLSILGVFSSILFINPYNIVGRANAAGLPAGYADTYTLKYTTTSSTTSQGVYVVITHSATGDLLYVERPEVGGNSNCFDDGWTSSLTTGGTSTSFEPAWTYNTTTGWCSNSAKSNLGKSLYIGEMSDGISVLQGNTGFNASVYGSPTSSTTSWTSYANLVEVKLTAYYTQLDSDGDGIYDNVDNCASISNADQKNSDGNAFGDACDTITISGSVSPNGPLQNTNYKPGSYGSLLAAYDLKNTTTVSAPVNGFSVKVRSNYEWSKYGNQLSNLKLYDSTSNAAISSAPAPVANLTSGFDYTYTFDLSASPLQISPGTTKTIYVRGDVGVTTYETVAPITVYLTGLTSTNNRVVYINFPLTPSPVSIESNPTNTSTTTTSSTGTTSTTPYTYPSSSSCTNSTESGMSCSICKDTAGALTSKSCWQSSSQSGSNTKSCDYSVSAEGLLCMSCKDTAGTITNTSCWKDTGTSQNYSSGGDAFYSTNDRYTYGAHCEYDSTKNWCEVCTQGGKEVRNTCTSANTNNNTYYNTTSTGTTSTTPPPTTAYTSNNGTYASNTCTNSTTDSNGMQCSTCSDSNGKLTSKSCWIQYEATTGSNYTSMPPTKSCDYYTENGLYCMSCKDTNGKTNNLSCWSASTEASYTGGGSYTDSFYTNNDRFTKGGRCDYPNAASMATSSASGYSTSNWCEVCSISGKEVKNTCSTSTNVLNTKEVKTLSNFCEYVQDPTTGTYCNVCYGSAKEVTSKKCDEGGTNTISSTDLASQIKNMQDSLKHRAQDLLEFSRFGNRIDRKIADYQEKIGRINKDFAWMVGENVDSSELDDIVSEMQTNIMELQAIKSEATKEYANFQSEVVLEKAALTYLSSATTKGFTWDHTDAAWLIIRRGDKFQALRDSFEGKLSYYEMMDNYLEWSKERAVLLIKYEMENIDVDSDSSSELQKGVDLIENMDSAFDDYQDAAKSLKNVLSSFPGQSTVDSLLIKTTRETFRSYFDDNLSPAWRSLRDARENMQNYSQDISDLWDTLNTLYDLQANQYNQQFLTDEIATIKTDISIIEAAFKVLTGKVHKKIQSKINDVSNVLPQVTKMLSDMESAGITEENVDPFAKLEKFGQYVDPKLMSIIQYLSTDLASLKLNPADTTSVKKFMEMDFSNQPNNNMPYQNGCMNCQSALTDIYGSDVATQLAAVIREQIMTEVISQLSTALADSLSQYLDSDTMGKVLKTVLGNLDKLKGTKVGEELGNQILENNTAVLDEVSSVDLSELKSDSTFKDEYSDLKGLSEQFQEIPIPDAEMATQISNYWSDVSDVVSDPTESELQALVTEGETLYASAEDSKYEYHLGFKDVPYVFDDDYDESVNWYSEYVVSGAMDGRWEGYKDSEGNPTYVFGPSDTTLRAEGLKMVLSTYGYDEGSTKSGATWWEGWKDTGSDLGLSMVKQDLSQPITRAEVARMLYEAGDMSAPETFNGYFPDVTQSDDWKPIEAAYEAGIFTGDGDTGTFRPYSSLNRAESAAVINRASDWKGGEDFVDEDLYSYLPWTSRFLSKVSNAFKFMANAFSFDS